MAPFSYHDVYWVVEISCCSGQLSLWVYQTLLFMCWIIVNCIRGNHSFDSLHHSKTTWMDFSVMRQDQVADYFWCCDLKRYNKKEKPETNNWINPSFSWYQDISVVIECASRKNLVLMSALFYLNVKYTFCMGLLCPNKLMNKPIRQMFKIDTLYDVLILIYEYCFWPERVVNYLWWKRIQYGCQWYARFQSINDVAEWKFLISDTKTETIKEIMICFGQNIESICRKQMEPNTSSICAESVLWNKA